MRLTFAEIAARYGTPAYVYELDAVREARGRLDAALPAGSELYYALKANPHPAVVAALAAEGCGAEVSSPGELAVALLQGVDPERIVYTGPAKSDAEIDRALAAGVGWLSVESAAELARVDLAAAGRGRPARCLLRVNPSGDLRAAGLAMMGEASQFGVDASQVLADPGDFRRPFAELRGVHLYAGSNIESAEALLASFELVLSELPALIDALDLEPDLVDLGGGFAHPYARAGEPDDLRGLAPRLEALVESTLGVALPGSRPRLAFESGRYLAGACGTLLATVSDVKRSRGRRFVVLDSGINHLGGMHGLRRLRRLCPQLMVDGEGRGEPQPADVVGPLCTPLDAWGRDVELPEVEPGDLIAVPNVGAYGLSASLVAFLGRELPVEVVVDGDRVVEAGRLCLTRRPVPAAADESPHPRRSSYAHG